MDVGPIIFTGKLLLTIKHDVHSSRINGLFQVVVF